MNRMKISKQVILIPLALLLIGAGSVHPSQADDARSLSGFSASLGFTGTHLSLQESATDLLEAGGIDLSADGVGLALQLKQELGANFALGLRFASSHHAGEDDGTGEVHFGQAMLEMMATLYRGNKTAPYLIGGIGGVGLDLIDTPFEDATLNAGAVTLGGGVDVDLSRRWALGFAYRLTSFQFDRETLVSRRAGEPDRVFDGAGLAHDLSFRWSFRF